MKKAISIVAIVAMFTLVFPVLAGGNGAVKYDLMQYGPPLADPVGSVVLNTTANGYLIAVVNIDEMPDLDNWDVKIVVRPSTCYGAYNEIFDDVLDTNAKGQGNATVKMQLMDYSVCNPAVDEIEVIVLIRQDIQSLTLPWAETGHVMVPLK